MDNFNVVVDMRTGLVMTVYTGDGPVTFSDYKEGEDPMSSMMEWDYD